LIHYKLEIPEEKSEVVAMIGKRIVLNERILYLGAGFLVCEKNRDLEENLVECNNLNNVIRRCVGKQMKNEI